MINIVKGKVLEVVEYLILVFKELKFKEIGVIILEEFVVVGDYLVYYCLIW